MKKIFIISIYAIILTFATISAKSATLKTQIIQTRANIASELSDAVETLRSQIKSTDELIKSEQSASDTSYNSAVKLKARVKSQEVNPTLLPFTTKAMKKCDSSENLYWSGSTWQCRRVDANADCRPSTGEVRNSRGICSQLGRVAATTGTSWSQCDNSKGERYLDNTPIYINSITKKYYEIEGTNTSGYETACGPNGRSSSCKCRNFYRNYVYDAATEQCVKEEIIDGGTWKVEYSRFCVDHFAQLHLIQDGAYVYVVIETQNPGKQPDGRCGYTDLSAGWLKAHGLYGPRTAYAGPIKILVGNGISAASLSYSFVSYGPGCRANSGTGVGNLVSGSVYEYPSSLVKCDSSGAQTPYLRINFNSVQITRNTYKDVPVCWNSKNTR